MIPGQEFIVDLGAVAAAVAAIGAVVWAVFRFAVLRPLDRRIVDATKQIQPEANGGLSLSDAHKKIDRLTDSVERLSDRMDNIEERQMTLLEQILQATRSRLPGGNVTSHKEGE